MEEWEILFKGAQGIVSSATSLESGVSLATEFARSNVDTFDDIDYWERLSRHNFSRSAKKVCTWAKEGLESLDSQEAWDLLVLDLGDCPEIFWLYSPVDLSVVAEQKVRSLLFKKVVIGIEDFDHCIIDKGKNPLFGDDVAEWTYHNVEEINDSVLTWNRGNPLDFHGMNGYFFWLVFASLALLEPLRQPEYCKSILRGRAKIYLLSGFEEIFLYTATVTESGLQFEANHT